MFDWERLIKPRYWLQNDPTDWEWDALLNYLIDNHVPVKGTGSMTVRLGEVEVWTSNFPYAYGSPYTPKANVLPSVATRRRLRNSIPPNDILSDVKAAVKRSKGPEPELIGTVTVVE